MMKPQQMAAYRVNTNKPSMAGVTTGYRRTCTICKEYKQILGGKRSPFICATCVEKGSE